jgi:hypothetical protein
LAHIVSGVDIRQRHELFFVFYWVSHRFAVVKCL